MTAILRREFMSYFCSPIAYVYLSVYYFFAGLNFVMFTLGSQTADITPVFASMFLIVLFLIPLLTMRLLSEDKKNRTDQALLTAPVPLLGIVLGKFLAAVAVYTLGLMVMLVYGIILHTFTAPNWAIIWGNLAAMLLLGMALIAIGIFVSSLTENQVIAAVGGFAISFLLVLVDSLAGLTDNPFIRQILYGLSISRHFDSFPSGVFDLTSIFFYFCLTAIFIFLSIRVLEKRRWG